MNSLVCTGLLSVFVSVFLLSGSCWSHPARAEIYAYTASNGAVNLSNVPADSRYSILVNAPVGGAAAVQASQLTVRKKALYDHVVGEVAKTYGLDSALLHAVITVESSYREKVVSKKGAVGLMQLMPATARHYGVADPLDPVQNLHGGAKHLRYLLKMFNNDVSLALAAYNSGEAAVAKYGNRIPSYSETMNYVPRVLGFYRKYQRQAF
ncbi:MAG TPA: lytic transglycosylase domain-containing protein [Sideroxyarcus sp.]|nr:lytic transglycosylase domain-containing protein [Sideroxyarcus sp.]